MSKYHIMDISKNLKFRLETTNNDTYVAILDNRQLNYDNIGALYYVIAVLLIYGLSIVMMIASHIRRNKHDGQLRAYLKDMAALRKKNRREQLLEKITDLASKSGTLPGRQTEESQNCENKIALHALSLYARLPSERDEDSQELLLSNSKRSYSNSDNDDSVFQLPIDTPIQRSPSTPKITTKLSTPKFCRADGKPFFQIQVINEHTTV